MSVVSKYKDNLLQTFIKNYLLSCSILSSPQQPPHVLRNSNAWVESEFNVMI